MNEVIAKKYVRALVKAFDSHELSVLLEALDRVNVALQMEDFRDIIVSPNIQEEQKIELVLGVFGRENQKFVHFIQLLAEKKRFIIIPEIHKELERYLSSVRSEYKAVLFTGEEFDERTLQKISKAFAKKLSVRLAIKQEVSTKEGVRLIVEGLGVEVSFSREKFVGDLREYILKAF